MATAITKVQLSGSTDGRMIKVAATSTPGTTIHTAHATALDEIILYAHNTSAADVVLTIEWGGTTSPDDTIVRTIPAAAGLSIEVPGITLTNSLVVKAFAATGDVILIGGDVNRIV